MINSLQHNKKKNEKKKNIKKTKIQYTPKLKKKKQHKRINKLNICVAFFIFPQTGILGHLLIILIIVILIICIKFTLSVHTITPSLARQLLIVVFQIKLGAHDCLELVTEPFGG